MIEKKYLIVGAVILVGWANSQSTVQTNNTRQEVEARAKVAQQRQESERCVEPINTTTQQPAALSNGLAVTDPSGLPIGDGMLVCDRWGGTGILQGGIVTDYAQGKPLQPMAAPQPQPIESPEVQKNEPRPLSPVQVNQPSQPQPPNR